MRRQKTKRSNKLTINQLIILVNNGISLVVIIRCRDAVLSSDAPDRMSAIYLMRDKSHIRTTFPK